MKPRCYKCKSYNVALVTSGLSCLDCGIDDSRIVPKRIYEQLVIDEVDWDGTPIMRQRSVREIVSLMAQARNPNHKGRETMPWGRDCKPDPGQLEMFDRDEFRVSSPQRDLF